MSAGLALKIGPTITNGVNVAAFVDAVEAIKADPKMAAFRFSARNCWVGGDKNWTTIKEFSGAGETHRTDAEPFIAWNGAPAPLLGDDKAPSPLEWLLHAMVGCMTTSLAYHAAARGIEIESIDSGIEGDIDLRGFFGLSARARKGYSSIRIKMLVKSAAAPATLKGLAKMSPLFDIVSNALPVDVVVATY